MIVATKVVFNIVKITNSLNYLNRLWSIIIISTALRNMFDAHSREYKIILNDFIRHKRLFMLHGGNIVER